MFSKLMELETRPRFHGNGIIQWYISPKKRLHVWSKELPAFHQHNALVHDHVFHMNSCVLMGTLNHQIMEMQDWDEENTHQVIQFMPDDRKSAKGITVSTGKLVCVHAVNIYAPGNYYQQARTFHQANRLSETVITLMDKEEDGLPDMARVICPIGEEPTDAFDPDKQPIARFMLEIVEDALDELGCNNDLERALSHV